MKVMNASEILKTPADTAMDCVGGTVVQVWQRRTGTSESRAWSIQNLLIGDGQNKVKVKVTGHQELGHDWVGHKLYIIAGVGKKGQSIGLKTELDTYKGETRLQVAVTENAQLTGEDPSATKGETPPPPPSQRAAPPEDTRRWPSQDPDQPGEEQGPPPQQSAPSPDRPPQRPEQPAPRSAGKDVRKAWSNVDGALHKLLRCRLRTLTTAQAIRRIAKEAGIEITNDHFQVIDSWLAVALERGGMYTEIPDCDPPMPQQDYGAGSSDGLPPDWTE